MLACSQCGEANPDRAKFCIACGTALPAVRRGESRKTVTVLFSDMVGSTELGDRLDPESIRRVTSRYFEAMQRVLESHGGTVEKFIGDAIIAVFGIPIVHEDDALRALRAATEMRERLGALNEELDSEWGVRLRVRTGINTGEVVAGDPSRGQAFVSGDTVNVAARLEQVAAPDEILVGERTWSLGEGAIEGEPVADLTVKGKPEPLLAWRLVAMSGDVTMPRLRSESPLLGRRKELEHLQHAFDRALDARDCVLATVVGAPGIGKSRLADEFTMSARHRARILTGRCLPYGEGITYWPLAAIVDAVAGSDIPSAVARVVGEDAPVIAERIMAAVGSGQSPGSPAEIFWAFRRFFEGLAQERPLIVVIDDLHWAEPTLLDLLDHITGFASGVSMLLLCLARPDLLESRPSWAMPRQNSVLISLRPISESDAGALIESIGAGAFSTDARAGIALAAAGNPLFIEQLLALNAIAGSGDGTVLIPPTMQALLAARIDRLDASDRAVIERASIEGRSFHRGAVVALLDDAARDDAGRCLTSLARREFIRPDRALFAGDEGFQFDHILIRDAAYDAVPKQLRAELHERFANWLERMVGAGTTEFEEILGYHLEQAHRYHAELGRSDDARRLAENAGRCLAPAGLRALGRGDIPAAINLLTRAANLLPLDDQLRLTLLPELGAALIEAGDMAKAEATLVEAADRARAAGDDIAMWRATIAEVSLRSWTSGVAREEMIERSEAAITACGELGDELGLARAWHLLGLLRSWGSGTSAADTAFQEALKHARQASALREESVTLQWMLINAWFGATPAGDGIRRCQEALERSTARNVDAIARVEMGCFLAMQGAFDEAFASFARGQAVFKDLGQQLNVAGTSEEFFDIAMLAGDPGAAEQALRSACDTLERMGEKGFLSTRLGCLAEAVYAQGRFSEAEQMSASAEAAAAHDESDIDAQFRWRAVRSKVLAQRGDHAGAETLAREAESLIAHADWPNQQAGVKMDLAEVLLRARRGDEAREVMTEALRLYEAKGNLVAAARTRALLDEQ